MATNLAIQVQLLANAQNLKDIDTADGSCY